MNADATPANHVHPEPDLGGGDERREPRACPGEVRVSREDETVGVPAVGRADATGRGREADIQPIGAKVRQRRRCRGPLGEVTRAVALDARDMPPPVRTG